MNTLKLIFLFTIIIACLAAAPTKEKSVLTRTKREAYDWRRYFSRWGQGGAGWGMGHRGGHGGGRGGWSYPYGRWN
ncbi:unnamed protein product [Strongylus vulgaris]|uniref:Uncharacterized protein n=1 Tax=Strongylus vulgaris TaxID=40348 RepID=A0A3P7HVP7_STRVU|nr:unnamed protein product [Strongylus vulgaris]